jgi:predicted cupin superfamily sugar epimerase
VTPDEIIDQLKLIPHPEGGHYVETWRGEALDRNDSRACATAIHYLLRAGERSAWHRVDACELWLFHAGGPLSLDIKTEGCPVERVTLGPDLVGGERPQQLVPAGAWQTAVPMGSWTLVSCVVVPGFSFDGFEMAPEGWSP